MEISHLVTALHDAGQTVTVVPDMCKTAISDARQMAAFASAIVVACYPRAVRSIFNRLGLKPIQVFDLRNHSSEQILNEMGIGASSMTGRSGFSPIIDDVPLSSDGPEAWYPVIDRERCTACGKCHDFCLFGVYAFREGRVEVTQPQNCKINCPACARACPSKAIIFPKYEKSPINGGLHDEEPLDKTDAKAFYNTALKQRLAERRAKVSLLK